MTRQVQRLARPFRRGQPASQKAQDPGLLDNQVDPLVVLGRLQDRCFLGLVVELDLARRRRRHEHQPQIAVPRARAPAPAGPPAAPPQTAAAGRPPADPPAPPEAPRARRATRLHPPRPRRTSSSRSPLPAAQPASSSQPNISCPIAARSPSRSRAEAVSYRRNHCPSRGSASASANRLSAPPPATEQIMSVPTSSIRAEVASSLQSVLRRSPDPRYSLPNPWQVSRLQRTYAGHKEVR